MELRCFARSRSDSSGISWGAQQHSRERRNVDRAEQSRCGFDRRDHTDCGGADPNHRLLWWNRIRDHRTCGNFTGEWYTSSGKSWQHYDHCRQRGNRRGFLCGFWYRRDRQHCSVNHGTKDHYRIVHPQRDIPRFEPGDTRSHYRAQSLLWQ